YRARCGRPPDGARGQQHAGMVGTAEGHERQHCRGPCRRPDRYAERAPRARSGRVTDLSARVAAAFRTCCRDELDAPKPGNVHIFSPGGRKSPEDFLRSAEAAAGPLTTPGASVGRRILAAVEATRAAVGRNTNLGIILLCAPLAAAAQSGEADLRAATARVLRGLDVADAELAFRAIVAAAPGGLGRAGGHDVVEPARVTLQQAMEEAADRDRIARQYVSDFDDVFTLGEPALAAALARGRELRWATLAVFLEFLTAFCDSHIV